MENLFSFHNPGLHNPDQRPPDSNALGAFHNVKQGNLVPASMKLYSNEASLDGYLPPYTFNGLAPPSATQSNWAPNWFYCLPRFRQAFTPLLNSLPKERIRYEAAENVGGHGNSTFQNGQTQKRFLVFDQSGDKTTLLYSSEMGTPAPYLNSFKPKPAVANNWLNDKQFLNGDAVSPVGPRLGPFLNGDDEFDEGNQKDYVESEMHEDTEELNALLYSDDEDDYSGDDEETSTGHSPSTMTAHRMQDWFEEKGEQVASSCGSAKRQKLLDGGFSVPSVVDVALEDTASSLKCVKRSELEDDAESSCGEGGQVANTSSPLVSKKRSRKENIHDTVRMLRSMIPAAKGNNAVDLIDDAIQYLRSLKAKANDLGLNTL